MQIYMFPGQGIQYKGMGGELFDRFPERTAQADAILGYSIREMCLENPHVKLDQTQFTQPALYVVNALSYFARQADSMEHEPDAVLGHSLGEFNALMAAGIFDFETGLRLVCKRGELMSRAKGGAMAAVSQCTREEIEQALRENGLDQVYLANYNSPSQIVLSGMRDQIAQAETLFRKGRAGFYRLATSGAFHSVFMREAMEHFREYLGSMVFSEPRIPVIANVTARPYRTDGILETLADQIGNPVRWSESVQYLLAQSKRRGLEPTFTELGPGGVLTRLVMTIRSQTSEDMLQKYLQEGDSLTGAPPPELAVTNAARVVVAMQADASSATADEKVAAWNARHRIGSRVRSLQRNYGELETRTQAMVLFGHRAAIYMKGYNGYFDLDEVVPA